MAQIKIGIVGCAGRMGRMLIKQVIETDGCVLAGGSERPDSGHVGDDVAALAGFEEEGLKITEDTDALFKASDVVIDFTAVRATLDHVKIAQETGTALVIGTTGFEVDQQKIIDAAAKNVAIVQAPNMSLGVNLLFALTEKVAGVLGEDYDIEIVEMHHKHKVDAPSGTALGLGRAAAAGRGVDLEKNKVAVRDGLVGERESGAIGFATLRGGDVVGEHTVVFAGQGERIELTHKAASRDIFAKGAVRAAQWVSGKKAGLYSMHDVLDLDA